MNFIKYHARKIGALMLAVLGAVTLASCGGGSGGGGGGSSMNITPPPATTPLRGGRTGRTFALSDCNDTVLIKQHGSVVLPSIDAVQVPSSTGTLRFEWDAFSIPDRFLFTVGGSTVFDTGYVGSSLHTMAGINAALRQHNLPQSTQTAVITPGSGRRDVAKSSAATSGELYIYAPLPGTRWNIRVTWICGSGGNPPPPSQGAGAIRFTLTDQCPIAGALHARFFGYVGTSTAGSADLVWPAGGNRVYTTGNRTTVGDKIQMTLGASGRGIGVICYGAQLENTPSISWGVGLGGNRGCSNCCIRVPSSGTVQRNVNLTCPNR